MARIYWTHNLFDFNADLAKTLERLERGGVRARAVEKPCECDLLFSFLPRSIDRSIDDLLRAAALD
jgi:hypothetical protein